MRREAGSAKKFFYCQMPRLRVRATHPNRFDEQRRLQRRIDRPKRDFRKPLLHSGFLQYRQFAVAVFGASSASLRRSFVVLIAIAHRTLSRRRVNTSLSGTLFFSTCWCIRNAVHSIPECTQRLSHLTRLEGNMAKKAKKAKKAKSAVKKTAKKTRKVAKKKK
jgi:hypothetical protein